MARYIDAEKIFVKIPKFIDDYNDILVPLSDVIKAIQQTPTADVQEVRHGRWEEIRDAYGRLEGWIHTECGREVKTKECYCPNCGAKMDEAEEQ